MPRHPEVDFFALPFADDAATLAKFRLAVDIAISYGDEVAAYVYARMAARFVIRSLGFVALPTE
jgi:hypothetical protein